MPSFENRANEKLKIDLIIQKLSVFEVENRLKTELKPLVTTKYTR